METIYKEEYFYDNCLTISPYQLFRNSIHLIEETKDEDVKQHLINQLCCFTGMIDFTPLMEECEKELKQRKFISEEETIESLLDIDDENEGNEEELIEFVGEDF